MMNRNKRTGSLPHVAVLFAGAITGWHVYRAILLPAGYRPSSAVELLCWELGAVGTWLFWNMYSALLSRVAGVDFRRTRRLDSWAYLPLLLMLLHPRLRLVSELFVGESFAVVWLIVALSIVLIVKICQAVALIFGPFWAIVFLAGLAAGFGASIYRLEPSSFYAAFDLKTLMGAQFGAITLIGVAIIWVGFRKGRSRGRMTTGLAIGLAAVLAFNASTRPKPAPALPNRQNIMAFPPARSIALFADAKEPLKVRMEVDHETRDALHFVEPGSAKDALFVDDDVTGLKFGVAVPFYARGLSDDGVTFSLAVNDNPASVWSYKLDPVRVSADRGWRNFTIDLTPWRGATVELTLKTEGAPHGAVSAPRLATSSVKAPPNVIILLIDTLRADRLSYSGYERKTSPNIDGLAERGVIFERAYSTAPWTEPATASLLTGILAGQMGVGYFPQTLISENSTTLAQYLKRQGYMTAMFSGNPLINKAMRFDLGFDLFSEKCTQRFQWRSAECLTDKALHWVDQQSQNPFFLYVHYIDPHARYDAPPPYHDRFTYGYKGSDERIIRGNTAPFEMKVRRGVKLDLPDSDVQYLEDLYDGEISYVDDQVGRFIRHLESKGLWQNTILVVTADHGEEFMEHGVLGHRFNLHSTLLRVPLIIVGPGLPAGKRVAENVSLADITPTILDMLGMRPDDNLWGQSALPIMEAGGVRRTPQAGTRVCFSQRGGENRQQWSVVKGDYRLIVSQDGTAPQLFDMARDPLEIVNLAGRGMAQEVDLKREIKSILKWIKEHQIKGELSPAEKRRRNEEHRKRLKALGYIGE